MNWKKIEAVDGLEGAEAFAQQTIYPILETGAINIKKPDSNPVQAFQMPMILVFIFTVLADNLLVAFLPHGMFRSIVFFMLFPVIFFGAIMFAARLFKDKIVDLITTAKASFMVRAEAMEKVAHFLDLTYIPVPGGAPSTLKNLSKWIGKPQKLEELITMLDKSGGLDEAIESATRAGLMLTNVIVLAKAENKQRDIRRQVEMQNLQDGFTGVYAGVDFTAFEWVQSMDKADDIHHLVLVLPAPSRLHSITELRTRQTDWPYSGTNHDFTSVDLGARAFKDIFKIRSTDQTEARQVFNPAVMERLIALAGENPMRAVAFSEGLVIDIAGADRFALSHQVTGAWSEASVQQTFSDIANLLEFIKTSAHSFMVPVARN